MVTADAHLANILCCCQSLIGSNSWPDLQISQHLDRRQHGCSLCLILATVCKTIITVTAKQCTLDRQLFHRVQNFHCHYYHTDNARFLHIKDMVISVMLQSISICVFISLLLTTEMNQYASTFFINCFNCLLCNTEDIQEHWKLTTNICCFICAGCSRDIRPSM